MSSGTGADLTAQEANDLLHKLITESTKLQAVLSVGGCPRLIATVTGVARVGPDNTVLVVEREGEVGTPHITFDPSLAVVRKYADTRGFPAPGATIFGAPRLSSVLCFVFADRSQLALFEVAERL